ncbi:MAG: hypothetical protein AAGA68_16785 [Pseudomonadota bacterium]
MAGSYAHERQVTVGARVGRIGLSGNTTAPYLHFNLFDQMDDPLKAAVLPFVIDRFAQREARGAWERREAATPAVGAWVAFDELGPALAKPDAPCA